MRMTLWSERDKYPAWKSQEPIYSSLANIYYDIMKENPISCERSTRLLNYFDTPIYNNSCLLYHHTSGQYVRIKYGIYEPEILLEYRRNTQENS